MQKLTYINLLNESAVFQGAAPFVFCEISGTGPVDIDTEQIRGAYQHGATLAGWRRDARDVTVTMHIQGTDRASLYRNRVILSGLLSMERAMNGADRARIIYENDYGRWWTWAVPAHEVDWGSRAGNYALKTKVRFVCESPFWHSMAQTGIRFTYGASAFRLPFRFPIRLGTVGYKAVADNAGQVPAPVEIWIHGAGEKPGLSNLTTGAQLRLTAPLPTGSVLYLNTDPNQLTATMTSAAGESGNAFGLVDVTYPLSQFVLRRGQNEIRYEPGGDSHQTVIEAKWYSLYEGV